MTTTKTPATYRTRITMTTNENTEAPTPADRVAGVIDANFGTFRVDDSGEFIICDGDAIRFADAIAAETLNPFRDFDHDSWATGEIEWLPLTMTWDRWEEGAPDEPPSGAIVVGDVAYCLS